MGVQYLPKRFIDQIDILLPVETTSEYKALWGKVSNLVGSKIAGLPPTWSGVVKLKQFSKQALLRNAAKQSVASLEVGTNKSKKRWFKLRLYPQNMGGDDFSLFQLFLACKFPGYHYQTFFHHGRISRLDIAADWPEFDMEEILVIKGKVWKSFRYVKFGQLGALYLGSPCLLRVYDKKKQLLAVKNKKVAWSKLVRFESVIRDLKCAPLSLIFNIGDPFTGIRVAPMAALKNIEDTELGWKSFLMMSRVQGVPSALHLQTPKMRKRYADRLAAMSFPFPASSDWEANRMEMLECLMPCGGIEAAGTPCN